MTNEQRNVLAAELDRVLGHMQTILPDTDGYHKCLESAFRLMGYLSYCESVRASCAGNTGGENPTFTPDERTDSTETPDPTPDERAADPENIEESSEAARVHVVEPEPKPVTPAPKATSALTRDDMITKLSYYRDLGVNVPEIMQSLGYDRLGAIPAGDYEKVLNAVMAAAEGKEAVDAP